MDIRNFHENSIVSKYDTINIKLEDKKPFWVYNNYADIPSFNDGYLECCIYDDGLEYVNDEKFSDIIDEFLDDEEEQKLIGWSANNYAFNLLCCKFVEPYEYHPEGSGRITYYKIKPLPDPFFDSKYPDLTHHVAPYLKYISPDEIVQFFQFHFINYKGSAISFFVNAIETVRYTQIWKDSVKDIERKREFKKWCQSAIEFLDITNLNILIDEYRNNFWDNDNEDLQSFINCINDIFSHLTNVIVALPFSLKELNSKDTNKYFNEDYGPFESDLYYFLNDSLVNYQGGSIYDYLNSLIKLTKEIWKESFADIQRVRIFDEWLEFAINEYGLDSTRLDIEQKTPPQNNPVKETTNTINHQSLVKIKWNGQHNVLADIFVQLKLMFNNKKKNLISNSDEDIAHFLKSNFSCFENSELSTVLTTIRSVKKEKNRPMEKNRIDIKKTDL